MKNEMKNEMLTPRKYQQKAVDFIFKKKQCGLFFEMSTGKTLITFFFIEKLKKKLGRLVKSIVISPKIVIENNWKKTMKSFDFEQEEIEFFNPEMIKKINFKKIDCIFLDESTKFKNPQSKRFKLLKKHIFQIPFRVLLTATPNSNSLLDIWSQIFLLDKGERLEKNFCQFRTKFFDSDFQGWTFTPKKMAKQQICRKISDITWNLTTKEAGLSLPKKNHKKIFIQITDKKMMKTYRFLEKNFVMMLKDEEVSSLSVVENLMKLRQVCNGFFYETDIFSKKKTSHSLHNLKIEKIKEIVNENASENFLIVYNFKEDLKKMEKNFQKFGILSDSNIERWNKKQLRVMALQQKQCFGLNLQRGGRNIIWMSPIWSFQNFQQMNGRLHRHGQEKDVNVFELCLKNTIEEKIWKSLSEKHKNVSSFLKKLKTKYDG